MRGLWKAWVPVLGEDEEDAREVVGYDAEEAAKTRAELLYERDSDHFSTFSGGALVHVIEIATGEESIVSVDARKEVRFSARGVPQ